MATAKITKHKNDQGGKSMDLTLKNLTIGELMAITRALAYYDSPVGNDVQAYIQNALYELKDEELSIVISSSIKELTQKMVEHGLTPLSTIPA